MYLLFSSSQRIVNHSTDWIPLCSWIFWCQNPERIILLNLYIFFFSWPGMLLFGKHCFTHRGNKDKHPLISLTSNRRNKGISMLIYSLNVHEASTVWHKLWPLSLSGDCPGGTVWHFQGTLLLGKLHLARITFMVRITTHSIESFLFLLPSPGPLLHCQRKIWSNSSDLRFSVGEHPTMLISNLQVTGTPTMNPNSRTSFCKGESRSWFWYRPW